MIYIGYNKRSCITAKALANELGARTINNKRFKKKPSVFVRWGNSYLESPEGAIEVNDLEAVKNSSNKLLMARILSAVPEAKFPKVWFFDDEIDHPSPRSNSEEDIEEFIDLLPSGLYFRNKFNQARLRNFKVEGDMYAVEKIDKIREFRVHVFQDEIVGVYEKIPYEGNPDYWKDDVCRFKRIDTASKEALKGTKGIRPAAKAAVKALGLVFGGADVMIDIDGNVFVNEVNTAPSLNTENVKRFSEKIKEYVENHH